MRPVCPSLLIRDYYNTYRHFTIFRYYEEANDEALPTAIVTGSTKCMEKASGELLAKRGHNVVICSGNQGDIDKTVGGIKSAAEAERFNG